MTENEAVRLVQNKFPNRIIVQVTEANKYFLLDTVDRKNVRDDGSVIPAMDDGLKAINKTTREIFTYNPMIHGN